MPPRLRDYRAGPAGVSKAEFRLRFSVLLPALGAVASFAKEVIYFLQNRPGQK